MTEIERLILELVRDHPGQWHWYHLDRHLSMRGLETNDLMRTIERFLEQGIIESRPGEKHAVYSLTEKGKKALSPT